MAGHIGRWSCATTGSSVSIDDTILKLPAACPKCSCLKGKIIGASAVCLDCGTARYPVSKETLRFLERIADMFGAPQEIVFRTADAREKIEQQDFMLRNQYASDGRSHYQIITDVFDGVENGGDEAPDDGSGAVEFAGPETEPQT